MLRHFVVGVVFAASSCFGSAVLAQSAADQRWHVADILSRKDAKAIQAQRAECAVGRAEAGIANARRLGVQTVPDAAIWCIATLTRAGRDGNLGYVRDPSNPKLTPALAFDNGFVTGYNKRASLPTDAPSMATLQPVVARCLGQREPDTALCNAAGYAVGARAARGELPSIR